ncbi:MAG: hypothetical protein C6P37_06765 [Caldibacillus debilis]|jgi:hypothetical protein|uniref:Uncharacterized protein n=1 Tax=Caldibacillus debilis TaxID=301148 RepID=A0A3E0K5D0_9BACI|nr:hypothetical protein [Bacillaceae bacterium]OUM83575.1 MAG: hypothetical protein BAA03_08075 [Caldibacillus debilis]REJ28949.1 MAG: hypothetical protein C6P37_06765 [Caldibacillus debilis]REJ31031.1 MAG: hypothetical protein C6W56_01595 [Caldibacillus debilis]
MNGRNRNPGYRPNGFSRKESETAEAYAAACKNPPAFSCSSHKGNPGCRIPIGRFLFRYPLPRRPGSRHPSMFRNDLIIISFFIIIKFS